MIGLYFIFLFCLWMILVIWVSFIITKKIASRRWRLLIWFATVCIVSPLVLIDEIVGKYQFEQLCQENSAVYIASDAKGRTVYLARTPIKIVEDAWVGMILHPWRFVDASTKETIISYNSIKADGGWFIRKFFSGNGPIFFEGECYPRNEPGIDTFENIGIKCIERPSLKGGG